MLVKTIIKKVDNGYEGVVLDWNHDSMVAGYGANIQNRGLKPFPKGSLVYAIFEVSGTGRRRLKKAWLKKSPIEETTLLETRLSPSAKHYKWLNARETALKRDTERVSSLASKQEQLAGQGEEDMKGKSGSALIEEAIGAKGVEPTRQQIIDDLLQKEAQWNAMTPAQQQANSVVITPGLPTMVPVSKITEWPPQTVILGVDKPAIKPKPKSPLKKVVVDSPLTKGYFIDEEARQVLTTAHRMANSRPERAVKVMMVGPSGYGKTTLPKLLSQVTGRSFYRMNCAVVRDPEEWFGYREAREGSTVFIRSEFMRKVEAGNVVVVLDEFNRVEPWLHNTLFPLLDDDGFTTVHEELFTIGQNVIVVGTINTGHRYTGTFELDEALLNRFNFLLEVGPMPRGEEKKVLVERMGIDVKESDLIVKVATILRQSDIVCSTRSTLEIAFMVKNGMGIRSAFEASVVKRIPVDSGSADGLRKQAIDLVNSELGHYQPRVDGLDVFQVEEVGEEVSLSYSKDKFTLFLKKGTTEFSAIRTISLIRRLPIGEDGEVMGLREAKGIADRILDLQPEEIQLSEEPDNTRDLILEFLRAGVVAEIKEH